MLFLRQIFMYLRIHNSNLIYKIVYLVILVYVKIFTRKFSLLTWLVNKSLKHLSALNIQLTFDSMKHANNCNYKIKIKQ